MNTIYYESSDTLQHYGVRGMKWGVRRYQNPDGSWTDAGEKRYGGNVGKARLNYDKAKDDRVKAFDIYNRQAGVFGNSNSKAYKNLLKASRREQWAKEDFSSAKILEKLKAHKIGKHEEKLRDKYKQYGMSEDEASIAAYKRVKTEKILAAASGLTIAAIGAYAANKYLRDNVDSIIKKGTIMQNIGSREDRDVSNPFYASKGIIDNNKYRGLYGKQTRMRLDMEDAMGIKARDAAGLLRQQKGLKRGIFESKIKFDNDIKIASKKSATEVLSGLVDKHADFKKDLRKLLDDNTLSFPTAKQTDLIISARNKVDRGIIDGDVYEAVNLLMTVHDDTSQKVGSRLYQALKDKGYGAIRDINDTKYSGYNAKTATIIFDAADKAHVDRIKELTGDMISKTNALAYGELFSRQLAKEGSAYAAAYGGVKIVTNSIKNRNDREAVAKYRKDHPNSKLTYTEIVRSLEEKDEK